MEESRADLVWSDEGGLFQWSVRNTWSVLVVCPRKLDRSAARRKKNNWLINFCLKCSVNHNEINENLNYKNKEMLHCENSQPQPSRIRVSKGRIQHIPSNHIVICRKKVQYLDKKIFVVIRIVMSLITVSAFSCG